MAAFSLYRHVLKTPGVRSESHPTGLHSSLGVCLLSSVPASHANGKVIAPACGPASGLFDIHGLYARFNPDEWVSLRAGLL
jgi:hypothetical protein